MKHQWSILLDHRGHVRTRSKHLRMKEGESPASGGGSPAPTAAPPASTTPASVAPTGVTAPPTPGQAPPAAPQPTDDIRDGDWRTLRQKYNTAQERLRTYDSLGIPDTDLPNYVTGYKAIVSEVNTLASELGYTDPQDIADALRKDPVETLSLLRREKAEAQTRSQLPRQQGETEQDFAQRVRQEVERLTKPHTEFINKQMTDAVMAKVNTTMETAIKESLPDAPDSVRQLVDDYVTEMLTYDKDAITAMRRDGDFSKVGDAVKLVSGRLKQVLADWVKHDGQRTGGRVPYQGQQPGQGEGGKRPSLDQMIEDPTLINPKYI